MQEVTARAAAGMLEIQANSATLFYHKLRLIIYENLVREADSVFCGEVELDESYFGGIRKGKRGRGAAGKIPVVGLLKRGGEVYTQVIADTRSETLMPIIVKKLKPDSIVYTDCYGSYNAWDVSEFKHYRINHSELSASTTILMVLKTSRIKHREFFENTIWYPQKKLPLVLERM